MSTEDLLDHYKVEAIVHPDYTLNYRHRRNRIGVRSKAEIKWDRTAFIGAGFFGEVWKEVHDERGSHPQVRAVKIIEKGRLERFDIDYKKELFALTKLNKEEYLQSDLFIVFLGWFETEQSVYLTMEYFEHGDLSQYATRDFKEIEIKEITANLLEGLNIMHAEGFAHRDLKPENIFVVDKPPESSKWWVKIGDFGITKRVKNGETALRTEAGTPLFQAPEIAGYIEDAESSVYNHAVDLWSLGCVIYNLAASRVPFSTPGEVYNYCQGRLPFPTEPLSRNLPPAGVGFVQRLLVTKPAQRMSAKDALQDAWLLDGLSESEELHTATPKARVTAPRLADSRQTKSLPGDYVKASGSQTMAQVRKRRREAPTNGQQALMFALDVGLFLIK